MKKTSRYIVEFPIRIKLLKSASDLLKYLSKDTQIEVIESINQSSFYIFENLLDLPEKELFEYSTPLDDIMYGYVAFWDRKLNNECVIIASHGFHGIEDEIPVYKRKMITELMNNYFATDKL
jgi:hypothetical protein